MDVIAISTSNEENKWFISRGDINLATDKEVELPRGDVLPRGLPCLVNFTLPGLSVLGFQNFSPGSRPLIGPQIT